VHLYQNAAFMCSRAKVLPNFGGYTCVSFIRGPPHLCMLR
jgi:hypothetical protein